MTSAVCRPLQVLCIGCLLALSGTALGAAPAAPTAEQALKLAPIQKDIDYDQPTVAEAAKCTIKAEKVDNVTGWVVRDANGGVLREFVDTNGDNVVDRWGYFNDGVEVYRDIDSDYNGRADQYRWLNTAGTRWAIDKNEDGVVDSWKVLSAEEATAEAIAAIRTRDAARFSRLLLTPADIKALGIGQAKTKEIEAKLSAAPGAFMDLVKNQKAVTPKTNWVHFGGTRPGMIPAGTGGATGDLFVYENIVAMTETDGQAGQIVIGSLVKVGDAWRLVDAPSLPAANGELTGGLFFQSPKLRAAVAEIAPGGPSEAAQKLLAELERTDDAINKSRSPKEKEDLQNRRAEILEGVIAEASDKDKAQWVKQLADTVSAAVQGGEYPGGVERMKKLSEKLKTDGADPDLIAYVQFRYLTADYGQSLQAPGADFSKIQTTWQETLEKFVTENPKSSDTAEALLQLAVAQEFAGQDEKAKVWHKKIVDGFPGTAAAKKAAGAITRLDSVGKSISLKGKTIKGETVDLSQQKGKVVLIQYWATWCEPAKADMAQIKEMQSKYGKNFAVIGVSLDSTQDALVSFLQQNRVPWQVVFEPGGLDSRLANEMGILTLPTMLLVDSTGKVVNRSVHSSELDGELKDLIKEPAAEAAKDTNKARQ
jgi:thiol-disulfide isomerase/thioredoxin